MKTILLLIPVVVIILFLLNKDNLFEEHKLTLHNFTITIIAGLCFTGFIIAGYYNTVFIGFPLSWGRINSEGEYESYRYILSFLFGIPTSFYLINALYSHWRTLYENKKKQQEDKLNNTRHQKIESTFNNIKIDLAENVKKQIDNWVFKNDLDLSQEEYDEYYQKLERMIDDLLEDKRTDNNLKEFLKNS
jgi:hypothetical protein